MTRIDKIEEDLKNLSELVLEQQKEIVDLRRQLMDGEDGLRSVNRDDMPVVLEDVVSNMTADVQIPGGRRDTETDSAVNMGGQRDTETDSEEDMGGQRNMVTDSAADMGSQRDTAADLGGHRDTAEDSGEAVVRREAGADAGNNPTVDMEKRMGNMMGIVASVMIFISIIFFVTMVYGELSKPLKVACIFIFSFALLGFGVYNMHKKVNGFTMSLTGCGMGAVYLSLFITHIYFGYMSQLLLYLLIAAWAAGVWYFLGRDYGAFKMVGQAGIAISVVFGFFMIVSAGYYGETELAAKLMFLVIFFSVTAWFYLLADRNSSNTVITACILLDEISMAFFFGVLYSHGVWKMLFEAGRVWVIVYMACILLNMLMLLWKYVSLGIHGERGRAGALYVPLLIVSQLIMYHTISKCLLGTSPYGKFAAAAVVLAVLLWIELSRRRKDMIHSVSLTLMYIMLFFATGHLTGTGCTSLIWMAYGFVLLSVGYRSLDRTAVYLSYASLALSMYYLTGEQWIVPKAAAAAAAAVYAAWKLYAGHEMYHVRLKLALYPILQLVLNCVVSASLRDFGMKESLCRAWGYIFCAAFSMAACQRFFHKSFDEDKNFEDSANGLALGINGMIMAWGSNLMFGDYHNIMLFVILAVVLAVYLVNVGPVFTRYGDNLVTGVYNGLKLTVYVWCVLKAYETSGPVVSLCWVALAIVFIAAGFKLEYKYLRVYGLWLTMFAVCKLLIADITYETAAVRTLSFLISGVLCFIINLIYNNAKKE